MTNSIGTALQQFFDESGCHFHQIDQGDFVAQYGGQLGSWSVFFHIRDSILCFASLVPFTAPNDRRLDVLGYLNHANCQMLACTFDMSPNGEIRLRTSLDCAGGMLTPKMIGRLLYRNVINFERHLPGLLHTLFVGASSHDDTQTIETSSDGHDEESSVDVLDELLSDVNLDHLPDRGDD